MSIPCNFSSFSAQREIIRFHNIPRLTPPSFLYELQNTTISSHNHFQFFDLDYYVILITTAVGYHISMFLFFTLILGIFLCFTTCCNPDNNNNNNNNNSGSSRSSRNNGSSTAARRNRRERPCAFCVMFILHVFILVCLAVITISPGVGST